MRHNFYSLGTAAIVTLALLAGCSSNSDYAVVSGVVTLDGTPLAGAGINFKPKVGAIASDVTDAEGRYRLTTGSIDGALLGDHRVTVAKLELVDRKGNPAETSEGPPARGGGLRAKWYTPEKYSKPETSGFTATVKPGNNDYPFVLISDSKK